MSRLRVIAGPNGSGKSSIFQLIRDFKENSKKIQTGPFVNSDFIERTFREDGFVRLSDYQITAPSSRIIDEYLEISTLQDPYDPRVIKNLVVLEDGCLKALGKDSTPLLGMVVSDLIREELLKREISFTMESVFSHIDKVNFMQRAKDSGFKVYLYFVSTESPAINIKRVAGRVAAGGHDVPTDKILTRYERTMRNLEPALKVAYRAYIFDNSGNETIKIAEKDNEGNLFLEERVPQWLLTFLGDWVN
ncbi:zeta toxin family protein [Chryseolinea lacunae]|uniref:Zeta toxin family protein n=1 Tax=Chryseolinea lacunae TaxID=2801331 RepID=A0ABS1KNM2_9BACT|nr:zeta toxin family protein [Chryseolinea lacunae]MBL0739851.1 zeta toxin family protein [Chryseolinea lacunae]